MDDRPTPDRASVHAEDPLGPAPDDAVGVDPAFAPTVDSARYRQVLGHFATGVAVVTASDHGEPAGLAVNSFTSVSLEPPLVAFCVAHTSATWERVQAVGAFCVNILSEDQEHLARVFATRHDDKFVGIGWSPSPSGAPIVAGTLAWVDCSVESVHRAGDHSIVVGRVRDLEVTREGRPLVFYRGGYGRFES
jgi:flavin reductase (DIM6/NTAB) family NADH-FMN oxidoreductase RutF